jgi:putative glutamine amidotransferase
MIHDQKHPVIGVVPSFDDGELIIGGGPKAKRIYMRRDYLSALASVGAVPVVITPEMPFDRLVGIRDGILISGGHDIDPRNYGEEPLPEIGYAESLERYIEPADRYTWEKELIDKCDEAGLPILGICYGMQRLNLHYGGTLVQHLVREFGTEINHKSGKHAVTFVDNFLGIKKGSQRSVPSRHHQALGRLAEGARICAQTDDGIVEAIIRGNHYGMQWHPESDITGVHVYRAFVERCME